MTIKNKARSLELFFVDGDPDGMLTATVPFQWTGHVLVTNRGQLKDALKRPEVKRPGVYLLVGENDDGPALYIGETDDISTRIKQHNKSKDWWSTAVFITSSGDTLNKAHAKFLESRLIAEAANLGKIALENGTNPPEPNLSEAARAHMEDFLENIYLVLPALRFDYFLEKASTPSDVSSSSSFDDQPLFYLTTPKANIEATAYLQGSNFVVEAGSKARTEWVGKSTSNSGYAKLFGELVQQGILVQEGNTKVFTKNYAFNAPSAAAAVIKGRSTSGPIAWKVKGTNKTYKEWEDEQLSSLLDEPNQDAILEHNE